MTQPTGHPMPLHRAAYRLRDHQSDTRSVVGGVIAQTQRMKAVAALRNQFGGHAVKRVSESG